jgi:uncharacterized membrane protein YfcA
VVPCGTVARMLSARLALLLPLLAIGLGFTVFWWNDLRRQTQAKPSVMECGIGFVTDFLDTLGVGSFATTTSLFRLRSLVPDRLLPGTLNVGHALPTIIQALIYIAIIEVDVVTLASMIAAAVAGAYLATSFVTGWSERQVRLGMGCALLLAASLLGARLLQLIPAGSDATELRGGELAVGLAGNFILGALMTSGVGLYAPCLILVSLLGMNPKAAFPIMMGSCAFLMPVASLRFVQRRSYAPTAALGLTLGGAPAVLIAAYLVGELPLDAVRWLVTFIAIYTALSLLRAARSSRPSDATTSAH